MLKTITAASVAFLCTIATYANDYENAWVAIQKKNFKEADAFLQKAKKQGTTALDAYLTQALVQSYRGTEKNIEGLIENLSASKDKNAYLFSMWFNHALLGEYGKKTEPHQLQLLQKVFTDNTYNGSIQSAAHYVKAMHHVFANEHVKARQEWALMGALENWQLVGPFENLSGSGFNLQHGPVASADQNINFKALNDIEVSWFTPAKMNNEGWIFTYSHIKENSAIVYAQTFVYSPKEERVLINAGGNGSLKVWVNDGLVLSEAKERVTELDFYKTYCNLNKGYNRILVQLGYTDKNSPNFIIRLTDEAFNPIKDLKTSSQIQPYIKNITVGAPETIKHFAEAYFENKIAAEPQNLINYILLSQTYLRNDRIIESRQVIEKALKLSPDNVLLRFELLQNLSKAENRTVLLQEVDWLKENDAEGYNIYQLKIEELIEEEKYTEADELLGKMVKIFGETEKTIETKITLLAKLEKIEELLSAIEKAHTRYPENVQFLGMMFRLKRDVLNDSKAALAVYEKYLKNSFNYWIAKQLTEEYIRLGMNDKYLTLISKIYEQNAYDPQFPTEISTHYFNRKNYSKALEYSKQALSLSPYTAQYWYNLGSIQEQMNNVQDAIISYTKSIYYDRTNYDGRKKLNLLQGKTNYQTLLPQTEVYELIKKAPSQSEYDFEYLLDEKGTIIYDKGASEEYSTYVAKIYTDKGIDTWKEIYIPYHSATQTLLIEKAEAVKPNGSKVAAEKSGENLVFTGLGKGDAIHVRYRLQNYTTGRMGKEYWDKFVFSAFIPSATSRYTLIVPNGFQFNSTVINSKVQPIKKQVDEVEIYTWEIKQVQPLKTEPIMPPLSDVGIVLHLSTIKSWSDIAEWYSDMSYQNNADNFEVNSLINEIFDGSKSLTQIDKARRIYNYIVTNIRYSSVPFRQNGLVPQSVSKTISTRLGDCKDLSSLFVALADKVGLQSQLVLVDTRNNGTKDMVLPAMEFNHCIVLLKLDGKDHYLELTDSNLPFGSIPYNLYGALSLRVPLRGEKNEGVKLLPLVASNRTPDKLKKNIELSVAGKDLMFQVSSTRYGALTSAWRSDYATLRADKQKEEYEQFVSGSYKNPVKLEHLSFTGLTDLSDSLAIDYNYVVKNEVIEAGSMKMIKVPFLDVIASIESFSSDAREFPLEYWNYENTDVYETSMTVRLGGGQKFLEIPGDQKLSFKSSSYSLKYIKEGDILKIYRRANISRDNIEPSDYGEFKKFISTIAEAENKYIVFK